YRDSKGNTRTRRVRKTRWYPASGVVGRAFDDVLVLGSDSLPRKKTEELEPWDLAALVDYDPAFVAGFTAEAYRVDLESGFGHATQIMDGVIRGDVRRDIGGDEQRIHSVKTQHDDITFKHILLPIWISSYRWKDKVYRFLVNGRTGEVQGERPWSWWKIAGAVLAGLIVVGAIAAAVALAQGG
ncbi:MAG: primosomal protein N' (replication factor Y) - superfamily II helicase, partial [Planctomycetota bacterium]